MTPQKIPRLELEKGELWGEFEDEEITATVASPESVSNGGTEMELPTVIAGPIQLLPASMESTSTTSVQLEFCPITKQTIGLLEHKRFLESDEAEEAFGRSSLPPVPVHPSPWPMPKLLSVEGQSTTSGIKADAAYDGLRISAGLETSRYGFQWMEAEALEQLTGLLEARLIQSARELRILSQRRSSNLECGFKTPFAHWLALKGRDSPIFLKDFFQKRVVGYHAKVERETHALRNKLFPEAQTESEQEPTQTPTTLIDLASD